MLSLVSNLLILADNGHMDWDDGSWIVMLVMMLLFWGLVIFAIVWGVRHIAGRGENRTPSATADDPLAVLDRRFAEGAISPEEYRERRTILSERDQS